MDSLRDGDGDRLCDWEGDAECECDWEIDWDGLRESERDWLGDMEREWDCEREREYDGDCDCVQSLKVMGSSTFGAVTGQEGPWTASSTRVYSAGVACPRLRTARS
jgi:hypothetical protein